MKKTRDAVRCFIVKNNKIVCIKYLKGREGFYDIPGGKIEENEMPIEAAKRECLEETGLEILNPEYKGLMKVEYLDRIYNFKCYLITKFSGEIKNFEENTAEWIEFDNVSSKNTFSSVIILEKHIRKALISNTNEFEIYLKTDDEENILELNYKEHSA